MHARAEMGAPSMFRFLPVRTILVSMVSHPPSPIHESWFPMETSFTSSANECCCYERLNLKLEDLKASHTQVEMC
jgi:hypothetical protein